MRSLSLSRKRSLSSSATRTRRSSSARRSRGPRLSTSTSTKPLPPLAASSPAPSPSGTMARRTRSWVGSLSSAAHRSASSSSSSLEERENTSSPRRHMDPLSPRRMLATFWISPAGSIPPPPPPPGHQPNPELIRAFCCAACGTGFSGGHHRSLQVRLAYWSNQQEAEMAAAFSSTVGAPSSTPTSFLGKKLKKQVTAAVNYHGKTSNANRFKVMAKELDEGKQTDQDRWRGLAYDVSDDQQDIVRGKGIVDSLFQAPMGDGTHEAVLSSYEYLSQGLRQFNMDNTLDGLYIAPAFMDKLVVHLSKNFMTLPNIKVPLILGIWGGKGQGKSFQCELVFAKMGITPIMMSAGELESGNAGEPAKLIRQRYREAADIIKKGKMCCLFINDLDAGAGRMGGTTQYTVNNQMVNATLMNIADNPTNVQLPGMYNKQENPRVPIIVTGNDFSTLYAPLIRDGRMEKFYWAPTREDRIGVCKGIFRSDNVPDDDIVKLVDTFPGQSIDFFGALRARVYDDEVRKWVAEVGVENIGKRLVNSREGPPTFEQPKMTIEKLLEYGHMLVMEQENVKRVQLADKYLSEAALGEANEDAMKTGAFYSKSQ